MNPRSRPLIISLILLTGLIIGGFIVTTKLDHQKSGRAPSSADVEISGALTMQGSFKAECDFDNTLPVIMEKNERAHVRVALDEGWVLNLYSPHYGDDEANRCPPGAQCLLIFHTLTPTLVSADKQTVYSVQTPADGDFNLHYIKQGNTISVDGELKTGEASNAKSVSIKAAVTCQE